MDITVETIIPVLCIMVLCIFLVALIWFIIEARKYLEHGEANTTWNEDESKWEMTTRDGSNIELRSPTSQPTLAREDIQPREIIEFPPFPPEQAIHFENSSENTFNVENIDN